MGSVWVGAVSFKCCVRVWVGAGWVGRDGIEWVDGGASCCHGTRVGMACKQQHSWRWHGRRHGRRKLTWRTRPVSAATSCALASSLRCASRSACGRQRAWGALCVRVCVCVVNLVSFSRCQTGC